MFKIIFNLEDKQFIEYHEPCWDERISPAFLSVTTGRSGKVDVIKKIILLETLGFLNISTP